MIGRRRQHEGMGPDLLGLVRRYTLPMELWRMVCQRYPGSPEHVREYTADCWLRAGGPPTFHGE